MKKYIYLYICELIHVYDIGVKKRLEDKTSKC